MSRPRARLLARIQLGVLYGIGIGSVGANGYLLYLQRTGQLEKVELKPSRSDLAYKMRLETSGDELVRQKLAARGYAVQHLTPEAAAASAAAHVAQPFVEQR